MNDANWRGNERRLRPSLSEEEIDTIAERAAAKVIQKIQTEVGKGVLSKILWIVGVISISAYIWLSTKGIIKPS